MIIVPIVWMVILTIALLADITSHQYPNVSDYVVLSAILVMGGLVNIALIGFALDEAGKKR